MTQIQELEEHSFHAWPALRTVTVGGWVFRLSRGFTKRANSVNAVRIGASFDGVREKAEEFYGGHNLPAVFRLTPVAAPEADRALDQAGYSLFDPSAVLVTAISASRIDHAVTIDNAPSPAWLDGFAAANGIDPANRPIHDRMVASVAQPSGFATLRADGADIGFGLAVREGGAVGLFDIVIAPAHRSQGNGRILTQALMQWGRLNGAEQAYLQVRDQNITARALYARLGFQDAYRYHYRVPTEAIPAGAPAR